MASELAGLSSVKNMLKDDVSGDWEAMAVRFIVVVDPVAIRLNISEYRVDKDIAFSIYGMSILSELNRLK